MVCPDCGTPMHRKCYAQAGHCPNSERHSDGYIFEGFNEIKNSAQGNTAASDSNTTDDDLLCPFCGEHNKKGAKFCNNCGLSLLQSPSAPQYQQPIPRMMSPFDPLGGVPADTQFDEDVSAADLACYVRVNTQYYVSAFDRIKKKSNRFNFSAAIFSGVWMLYRKQYKLGSVICALNLLIFALQYYLSFTFSLPIIKTAMEQLKISADINGLTMEQYAKIGEYICTLPTNQQLLYATPYIASFLFLILAVVMGIVGNKLYYKHCIAKIKEIKANSDKEHLPQENLPLQLNSKGGVNMIVVMVFLLFYLVTRFL